jgi:hypothetical protein
MQLHSPCRSAATNVSSARPLQLPTAGLPVVLEAESSGSWEPALPSYCPLPLSLLLLAADELSQQLSASPVAVCTSL